METYEQQEEFYGSFYSVEWEDVEEIYPPYFVQKIQQKIMEIEWAITDLRKELKYSWEGFFGILSGFSRIEFRRKLWSGGFEEIFLKKGDYVDTWYSLAVFNNGKKIPLPIIMNNMPRQNRIQKFFLCLAGKFSKGLSEAKKAAEDILKDMEVEDSPYLSEETLARLRAISFAEDDDELFEE